MQQSRHQKPWRQRPHSAACSRGANYGNLRGGGRGGTGASMDSGSPAAHTAAGAVPAAAWEELECCSRRRCVQRRLCTHRGLDCKDRLVGG